MVKRNKGLEGEQALVWDAQNRLSQVRNKSGDLVEQYWYGVDGARVKKTSGGTTTYTFFAHYEEEVTGTVTTAVSHYSFGGLRFAVKRGAALHHLHGDHLGSTSLTTDTAGAATASRAYYAYGAERSSTGELQTDRTFTGQKRDATGLMQYNARYYDPALGTFVSSDSLVPDPGMVLDYNRFLYVRGSPLTYADPTGHFLETLWDIASIDIGVASLAHNISEGSTTEAWIDAGGLAIDVVAAAIPLVPGGVSAAIKAGRGAQKVSRVIIREVVSDNRVIKETGEAVVEFMYAKDMGWTQESIRAVTSHGPEMDLFELRNSILDGWKGPALHVVEDAGQSRSLDNRRLAAAKMASNFLPDGEDLLIPVVKLDPQDQILMGRRHRTVENVMKTKNAKTGFDSIKIRNPAGGFLGIGHMDGIHDIHRWI